MRVRYFALSLFFAATAFADGVIDPQSFTSLSTDPNDPQRVQLRNIIFAEETARHGRPWPEGTHEMVMTANGDHILVTFVTVDGRVTGQRRIDRGGAGSGGGVQIQPLGHSPSGGMPILGDAGASRGDPSNGASIRVSGYQRIQIPSNIAGPDARIVFSNGTSFVVPTVKQSGLMGFLGQVTAGATFGVIDAKNNIRFYRKGQGSLTMLYPSNVNLL